MGGMTADRMALDLANLDPVRNFAHHEVHLALASGRVVQCNGHVVMIERDRRGRERFPVNNCWQPAG